MEDRRVVGAVALSMLLLPPMWQSVSHLREDFRSAADLRGRAWSARQRAVYGDWYAVVQRVAATTPNNARVDVVMLTPDAWGIAVFTAAALTPRSTAVFLGEDAWRRRERAAFMHDARAVNAAPGPPPAKADVILYATRTELRDTP